MLRSVSLLVTAAVFAAAVVFGVGVAAVAHPVSVAATAEPSGPDAPAIHPPLCATFSIVARDTTTGEIGVGVQSHWFSVGSVVPWAEADVGAVATQSFAEPAYGPRILERVRNGERCTSALVRELDADSLSALRQVLVLDAAGNSGAHTGAVSYTHLRAHET